MPPQQVSCEPTPWQNTPNLRAYHRLYPGATASPRQHIRVDWTTMCERKVWPLNFSDRLASWTLGCAFALQSTACSSTAAPRCNPRIDDCSASGDPTTPG